VDPFDEIDWLRCVKSAKEKPTIDRLLKFIESNNKEIVGDHEEEYVRGPKLFGLGDPKKFLTIIRYRIREKEKQ